MSLLGGIGTAIQGIGKIGGLWSGSKKPPPIPPEAKWGLDQSKLLAERGMNTNDLLNQQFLQSLPQIQQGYGQYRAGLDDIIGQFNDPNSLLGQYRGRQLGKIADYDAFEANLFRQASRAGSPEQIRAKRMMAREDAQAGLSSLLDATRTRQAALGLGPRSGGASNAADLARFGHQAGAGIYGAGEQERRFGLGLQTQLYPMAATGAQRAISNYMLPQQFQRQRAQSFGDQAATTQAAYTPVTQSYNNAIGTLQNLAQSVGGYHTAQLRQHGLERLADASKWAAVGEAGKLLTGGQGTWDIFGGGGGPLGGGGGGGFDFFKSFGNILGGGGPGVGSPPPRSQPPYWN